MGEKGTSCVCEVPASARRRPAYLGVIRVAMTEEREGETNKQTQNKQAGLMIAAPWSRGKKDADTAWPNLSGVSHGPDTYNLWVPARRRRRD